MIKFLQKLMAKCPVSKTALLKAQALAEMHEMIEHEKDKLALFVDSLTGRFSEQDIATLHKITDPIVEEIDACVDLDILDPVAVYRAFFAVGYLTCKIKERVQTRLSERFYDA